MYRTALIILLVLAIVNPVQAGPLDFCLLKFQEMSLAWALRQVSSQQQEAARKAVNDFSMPEPKDAEYELEKKEVKFNERIREGEALAGTAERATMAKLRRRLGVLRFYLRFNMTSKAVELYKKIFFDVEEAYHEIKKTDGIIATIREGINNNTYSQQFGEKLIASYKSKTAKFYKTYGQKQFEYLVVRAFLEATAGNGVLQDSSQYLSEFWTTGLGEAIRSVVASVEIKQPSIAQLSVAEAAKTEPVQAGQPSVQAAPGVSGQAPALASDLPTGEPTPEILAARAKSILKGLEADSLDDRPKIPEMTKLFTATTEAKIAKLKFDQHQEWWASLKSLVTNVTLLKALQAAINKLPVAVNGWEIRGPVSEFFGMAYDVHVVDTYLNYIEQILANPSTRDRLKLLLIYNGRAQQKNELLETFARLASNTDDLADIMNLVHQYSIGKDPYKPSSEINQGLIDVYTPIRQQFLNAITVGSQQGSISLFYPTKSGVTKITIVGFVMVGGLAYYHGYWLPPAQHFMETILAIAHSVSVKTLKDLADLQNP